MKELGKTLSEQAQNEIAERRKMRTLAARALKLVKLDSGPCDTLDHYDYDGYMESASHTMCSPPGKYQTSYRETEKKLYEVLDFVAVRFGPKLDAPGQILGIFTELEDSDTTRVLVRLHRGLDWKSPHGDDVITLSQDRPVIVTPDKLRRLLTLRIGEDKYIGRAVESHELDEKGRVVYVKTYHNPITMHPEMLMEGWEHHEETEPPKLVPIKTELEKLALRDSFVRDSDTLYYNA
jgi:NADH:ubiquinone oxidoreductase subunit